MIIIIIGGFTCMHINLLAIYRFLCVCTLNTGNDGGNGKEEKNAFHNKNRARSQTNALKCKRLPLPKMLSWNVVRFSFTICSFYSCVWCERKRVRWESMNKRVPLLAYDEYEIWIRKNRRTYTHLDARCLHNVLCGIYFVVREFYTSTSSLAHTNTANKV